MGAPRGNTNAVGGHKAPDRPWADALRRSLAQFADTKLGVKRGEALRRLADRLVRDALEGDADARREIGNRLDGRPAQQMTVNTNGQPSLVELLAGSYDKNVLKLSEGALPARKVPKSGA